MRTVFLAIVWPMRSNLRFDLGRFALDVLPGKQSGRIEERDVVISWQPLESTN